MNEQNCPDCGHKATAHKGCEYPYCDCTRTYESLIQKCPSFAAIGMGSGDFTTPFSPETICCNCGENYASHYESLVGEKQKAQVKTVCDKMWEELDNPISPSGRYGLASIMNDPPFVGIKEKQMETEPTLVLTVVDFGKECVVRVDDDCGGSNIWATTKLGKLVPTGYNMWPIIHVPHPFTALREAIEQKPVPRIERNSDSSQYEFTVYSGEWTDALSSVAHDSLSQLAGKPLPIYKGGTWIQIGVESNGQVAESITIWRYKR